MAAVFTLSQMMTLLDELSEPDRARVFQGLADFEQARSSMVVSSSQKTV